MLVRIRPETIPEAVRDLCQVLARAGHGAWVVGGCLRDLLRGAPAADWDLATSARPEQVRQLFRRVIPTGIQHGTVTVRLGGQGFEVTTLRGEGAYSDGRRPDRVEFVEDVREDLARRDFTVNAMAYDPIGDRLEDPFGGIADLSAGLIRAVGDPHERFSEDGLRVLRAARFAATLEFELDPLTEAAIRPTLDTFRKVSAERVRDEWNKALAARIPSRAFEIMARTGIVDQTFPALLQRPGDEWAGRMRAVDNAPVDLVMRLSALCYRVDPEEVGRWLTRYRYSNRERQRVMHLLAHLPRAGLSNAPDPDLRRWARAVGRDDIGAATELNIILQIAHAGADSAAVTEARRLQDRLTSLIDRETPLSARDLKISGRDLMQDLGLSPGPKIGETLEALLQRVLEEPELNQRPQLLKLAKEMAGET